MRKRARASYVLRQLESVSHDFLKQQKYVKQLHWLYRNGHVLIVIAVPDSHVLLSFGQNLFNLVGLAFALYAGCLVWNISSTSTNIESCSTQSPSQQIGRNTIKMAIVVVIFVHRLCGATLTIRHEPTS